MKKHKSHLTDAQRHQLSEMCGGRKTIKKKKPQINKIGVLYNQRVFSYGEMFAICPSCLKKVMPHWQRNGLTWHERGDTKIMQCASEDCARKRGEI